MPEPAPARATNATLADVAGKTFDYVVVGGGTAGLAVAARLSENPKLSVAVLEAGQWRPDCPKINTPAAITQPFNDPAYDWCLKTVPQENAGGRVVDWPRGRVLGGSSALNYLVHQRGHRREFDDIAALGNPGWEWESILPYYSKSVTAAPPHPSVAEKHKDHHTHALEQGSGPIQTSFPQWYAPSHSAWYRALEAEGVKSNASSQSGANKGSWTSAATVNEATGKRSYSTAYYEAAKDRPNFKVLTGVLVTRVQLEKDGAETKATGVVFELDEGKAGEEHIVSVSKEVVLSAGAIQTPQLLELSGIGDKAVLDAAGITQLVDLPGVGTNLSEHVYISSSYELTDRDKGQETWDHLRNPSFAEIQMKLHTGDAHDRGMFSSFISGFTYLALDDFLSGAEKQELLKKIDATDQTGWTQGMKDVHAAQRARLSDDDVPSLEQIYCPGFFAFSSPPKPDTAYATILTALQHPWSRGHIHITSKDPRAKPSIDPRYFSSRADLDIMTKGMAFSDKVMAHLGERVVARQDPPPNATAAETEAYVAQHFQTTYHHLATASMLPRDKGGVVDHELRVHGVRGLRVADASVIPLQLSAHIQATVYAIGERAAELLQKA